MHQITSHIDIDATPEQVWAVLSNLDRWNEWNPFVVQASGVASVDERLVLRMQLPGRKPVGMKPTVTEAEPGVVFEWLGSLGVRGIFDGRHRFELETRDGGTRVVQSEQFTGILAGLVLRMVGDATVAGFEAMNAALKDRVETANMAA